MRRSGVAGPVMCVRSSERGASKRSKVRVSLGEERVSSRGAVDEPCCFKYVVLMSHVHVLAFGGVNHFDIAGSLSNFLFKIAG